VLDLDLVKKATKLESGMNAAFGRWVPTGSVGVDRRNATRNAHWATEGVVPSVNCTLPAAVGGVTIAVNVSVVPATRRRRGQPPVCGCLTGAGVIAIPTVGPPTGIGGPGWLVATVIGVTVVSPWLVT
jgi:hypothetical protein